MKRKGINPLEQHAEKVVVGVFLAAAAGVFAMQIVSPTTVTVDREKVSPQRAYDRVASRAEEVASRLRSDRAPEGLPDSPPDMASDLQKRLRAPALPTDTLVGALGRPNSGLIGGDLPSGGDGLPVYALLTPPSTGRPVPSEYRATIDPLVIASVPELARYVPPVQPYDVRAVSVSAMFPTNVLLQRLSEDPDGSGPAQAPPRFWWLNSMAVLDVRLEREELQTDGTFGGRTIVAPMPAQYSLRGELSTAGGDLGPALREARMKMADLAQPRFYATIAGPDWAPPRVSAPDDGEAPVADLAAELARKRRALESLDAQIKRQKDLLDKPPPTTTRPSAPGAPGPGRIGGGGGPGARIQPSKTDAPSQPSGTPGGPSTTMTPEERRKELLRQNIARLEADREALAAEIAKLESPSPGGEGGVPDAAAPVRALESGEPFSVWAHDITVSPGKTYRYRVSVAVTNPLYGNARSMAEASRPLAAQPAIVSAPSPWSEPVSVSPDAVVFFTSARGQGLGGEGGASATAEVYRFYYGYWRGRSVTLRPGDALAAEVDVPELPLFEVTSGPEGPRVASRGAGLTRVAAGIPGGFVVDVLSTPAEGPGGRDQIWQVVYRDGSGRLVVSTPGASSGDLSRRAVEASEAEGKVKGVKEPGAGAPADAGGMTPGDRPASTAPPPSGFGG